MKIKRAAAAVTAVGCFAAMLSAMPLTYAQATELVHNDFEINYGGWYAESPDWSAELNAVAQLGFCGTRGLKITGRTSPADGAVSEKDFYLSGGRRYDYSVRVFAETDQTFTLTLLTVDIDTGRETLKQLDRQFVRGGTWAALSASYKAPENSRAFKLSVTTDTTDDFIIDDVSVVSRAGITVSAAELGIKDEIANYGIRSGNILNGSTVNDDAIKNILLRDCNAIECENETKPDATLVQYGSSDNNIKVQDSSFAKIADWCAQNGLAFRGHTMVWHSQTPEWFFKDNFQNSGNWVSSAVMDQRLESYIKNMFALFSEKYPNLNLYAYDICNECVSDDQNRTAYNGGARVPGYGDGASPWVQVYGSNVFVEKAFALARKYAPANCKLYYNDYNEYWDHKRDCIYNMCKKIYEAGNLDGVGMQSHISAEWSGFTGYDNYTAAMEKYLSIGCDVQITELDISVDGGSYSYDDQARKYKAILQYAMDWNAAHPTGGRVTLFQVWGPNDGHSWLKAGSNALLYDENNNPKSAYSAVTSILPKSEWGDGTKMNGDIIITEPEPDADGYWFHYTFENGTEGFAGRSGSEVITSSGDAAYAGSKSLYISGREAAWHGAAVSLNGRTFKAGEQYSFSANVMLNTGAQETVHFTMQYKDSEGTTRYIKIDSQTATRGEWVQLFNTGFEIPAGASDCMIYFECDGEDASFYVDEVIGAPNGTVIAGAGAGKTLLTGDVDCNGVINGADLTLLKRGCKTGKFAGSTEALAADIDQSGEVDATDIRLLCDYLTGRITEFPVAERKVDFTVMEQKFKNLSLSSSWKYDGENNPMTTQRFGADPGWLVYQDRLYIYTTNDAFEYDSNGTIKTNSYDVGTINCVSSSDLVNWTDHGAIPVADGNGRTQNGAASWAFASWAPDACWKTIDGEDKFFLYFANSGGGIGVLTADSPTGPWTDPLGHALLNGSSPNCSDVVWMFDPGVYYDPDTDEAYLFFGGGRAKDVSAENPGTGRVVKLGKDMISLAGDPVRMQTPYLFEDSSVIKIGDTWYYSYCANWDVPGGTSINGQSFGNADICYMTSKDPLGPWGKDQFAGMVFGNTGSQRIDNGGNNHHSIIYFKGQYYVAYHSRQQEMRMNGGSDRNYRSTQINKANYNASTGKITCSGDMKGVSQLEYLDPYQTVPAECMAQQAGIQISGLGDTVVTDIQSGDWTKVKGVDFGTGCRSLTVRVSSADGAAIKVCTGSPSGDAFTYVDIPAGTKNAEITVPTLKVTGVNDVCFVFSGSLEFDSWKLS